MKGVFIQCGASLDLIQCTLNIHLIIYGHLRTPLLLVMRVTQTALVKLATVF